MYSLQDVKEAAEALPRDEQNKRYRFESGRWIEDDDTGTCRYSVPGTAGPSCFAGTLIFTLDVELFNRIKDEPGQLGDIVYIDEYFEQPALHWLIAAQLNADNYDSWGVAIDKANVSN